MPRKPADPDNPDSRGLDEYQRKRSFDKTPEPAGSRGSRRRGAPRFVVQEHHARRLHWDLRLERHGVLVSWALPRGVPDDPQDNHLAVHTEDHPLEYLTFAGDIPSGEYGGGTMKVWDTGTYETEKFSDREVMVRLDGTKVHGRYVLFQTKDRDWMIHRLDPPDPTRTPMPDDIAPMAATLSTLPRDDHAWGYEIKWDGVRAIAYCDPGRVRLVSRNDRDITRQYPEIGAPFARRIGARRMVLDGELVAFDAAGRPSFQRLQRRMHIAADSEVRRRQREVAVTYVIFDLLYLDGELLVDRPYEERRRELEALGLHDGSWQTPSYHRGDGAALLAASGEQGLEGIVAKRLDSAYQPGRRSRDWLKVKNVRSQEVVIGGWVEGEGRREGEIGALLVGYYAEAGSVRRLRFAGKVGTGFDASDLRLLAQRLQPLRRDTSPFDGRQPQRDAIFVEPELVCGVEFAEWTNTGTMRHPSYEGLRDDRPPTDVVREDPAPPPTSTEAPTGDLDVKEALTPERTSARVRIDDRELTLSNLDAVLYPDTGTTKRDVIDYYTNVAPVLLRHLAGRSVAGEPAVEDLASLVWAANLTHIELDAGLARVDDPDRPTGLVLDLLPGDGAGLRACAREAGRLRELLDDLALRSLALSSGTGGLQVRVPLNTPVTYDDTRLFAQAVAGLAGQAIGKRRRGTVSVDWSRNAADRTTAVPFSLRAGERPMAVTPLDWDEVDAVADGAADPDTLLFDIGRVVDDLDRRAGFGEPLLTLKQKLPR